MTAWLSYYSLMGSCQLSPVGRLLSEWRDGVINSLGTPNALRNWAIKWLTCKVRPSHPWHHKWVEDLLSPECGRSRSCWNGLARAHTEVELRPNQRRKKRGLGDDPLEWTVFLSSKNLMTDDSRDRERCHDEEAWDSTGSAPEILKEEIINFFWSVVLLIWRFGKIHSHLSEWERRHRTVWKA